MALFICENNKMWRPATIQKRGDSEKPNNQKKLN